MQTDGRRGKSLRKTLTMRTLGYLQSKASLFEVRDRQRAADSLDRSPEQRHEICFRVVHDLKLIASGVAIAKLGRKPYREDLRQSAAGMGDGSRHSHRGDTGAHAPTRAGDVLSGGDAERAYRQARKEVAGSALAAVRDSVQVKLYEHEGELYVLARSEGGRPRRTPSGANAWCGCCSSCGGRGA